MIPFGLVLLPLCPLMPSLAVPTAHSFAQSPAPSSASGQGERANPFEPTGNLRKLLAQPDPAQPAAAAAPAEHTAVLTLYYPNALDVAVAIQNLFGERVRLSLDHHSREDQFDEINQRFQRFDLLGRRLQGRSWGTPNAVDTTGASSSNSAADDESRAVLAEAEASTQARLHALEQAVHSESALDAARLASLRHDQAPIYVSILQRNNQIAARSSDAQALEDIETIVRTLDVPTPQVLLEVQVLSLDLGDAFNSGFDFGWNDGSHSAGQVNAHGPEGAALAGGLLYNFVDDHIRARLELLQHDKRVSTLATPLLLVANNEVSRLFIGEERPVVRSISSQTTLNNNIATTTPNSQIEIRPVGTTLLITPNINADRTVTLRVLQETSEIHPGAASIPVVSALGTVVSQPVDVVSSRTVTGTVVAKDGLALALGGLIEEGVSDAQVGVPFLMDLPLVGALFRHERKGRFRRELVVIIRPWVLFTASEGQQMSAELSGRLQHPSAASMGGPIGAFDAKEAPRGGLAKHPFWEMFKYQSGLPDGL